MSHEPTPPPDRPAQRPFPVAAPAREKDRRKDGPGQAPDLGIEEIEERHIPKDRNVFDK